MLSRTILFSKPLIRFVFVRTFLLAVAFSVGFNFFMISEVISAPAEIKKLFMHNWGYLLLSYTLLVYGVGLVSLLGKKSLEIGFQGMVWITGSHAIGSLLFLGKIGKVGLIIGAICYGLALVLLYLWEVVLPNLISSVAALPLPPFVQERIPRLKAYFRAKPSAPFILSFMGLLMICAFLLIFKLEKAAEHVANVAYLSLVIGVGIEVYQLIKEGQKEGKDGGVDL